ncbi:MAG: glycosyltransferase [Chthoniobacterales bacterium]|nr:glycosyltransferase [Chthoniobacterales bacterium]
MKSKILIVSPCQGAYGGIEAFVLALAAAVRQEPDLDVRLLFKRVKGFALQPDLKTMLQGEDTDFVNRANRELAELIKWADLVHLQNASPDVVALARLFRKRLALTIHNHMPDRLIPGTVLWRISANMADARWYNSEFVRRTWEGETKHVGSRKVPTVSRLPEGWTEPEQRRGLVFIGRWVANKGVDTLIDAYALAGLDPEKWPLILMGDGPLRSLIEYAVQRRGIRGVQILGFVDEVTKSVNMKNARWAVVPPNTREDFGLTAVEARHLGVPCIITRDGGLPEAGGRQALICDPADPKALAQLLQQAAAMSKSEYAERALRTREELKSELEPMEFYASAYRKILQGEIVE